jgi:hypothetical protein
VGGISRVGGSGREEGRKGAVRELRQYSTGWVIMRAIKQQSCETLEQAKQRPPEVNQAVEQRVSVTDIL